MYRMEEEIDLTNVKAEEIKPIKKVKELPPFFEDVDEDGGGFIQDPDYL